MWGEREKGESKVEVLGLGDYYWEMFYIELLFWIWLLHSELGNLNMNVHIYG